MDVLGDRLSKKIDDLNKSNTLRTLKEPRPELIDFTSNDYLGLARSKDLNALISQRLSALEPYLNGSTGSRLLAGNSLFTESVEQHLAKIFNSENTLIFNSGYTANLSVLSSIPQKGDTILYDEYAHASIKDGARLSLAHRFSFRHNDLHDLRKKLKNINQGLTFIAVESIYSMDGDVCPLQDLVSIAKEFSATIILDEAHSTGVMGKGGNGLATSLSLEQDISIRIYTFGKAMGIHGACVAGSETLRNCIINTARPFIYTTALPVHNIAAIECAFHFLENNVLLQNVLDQKIKLFKQHCKINTHSHSAIQPILFSNHSLTKQTATLLNNENFDVRPILSPTVKIGTERLRVCLHTYNEDEDIVRLAQTLNKVYIDHQA